MLSKQFKAKIFLFPVIFLCVAGSVYLANSNFYYSLFGVLESGFFEWVRFGSYLLASLISFKVFSLLKHRALKGSSYAVFMFACLCAFVALEEISYGQHIFHWQTPEYFSSLNLQGETNLHNLSKIQGNDLQEIAFVVVGFYGSFAWLVRENVKPLSIADMVLPEWFASLYFSRQVSFMLKSFMFLDGVIIIRNCLRRFLVLAFWLYL